jgi:hypothetical protein
MAACVSPQRSWAAAIAEKLISAAQAGGTSAVRLFSLAKVSSNPGTAIRSGGVGAGWSGGEAAIRSGGVGAGWSGGEAAIRSGGVGPPWSGGEAAIRSGGVGPNWSGGAGGSRRPGHGVGDHVVLAGDVHDVTCVLPYVGQVAALPRRPGVRGPCQGECDGLVVCEYRELTSIKHVPEVPDPGCAGQKLPVESRVALLCWVELLLEETKWLPA